MRLLPVLTATLVVVALYLLVLERDAVLKFAAGNSAQVVATDESADAGASGIPASGAGDAISVVALRSVAQTVDGAVILRGRTEAARQVDVRAETSGRVVSEPARRGATVIEGDLLCVLDPGTRQVALNEAEARLREAELRLPEAEARLVEAEINGRAAARLNQGGFASETRVAQTAAAVEAARAPASKAPSLEYRRRKQPWPRHGTNLASLRSARRFPDSSKAMQQSLAPYFNRAPSAPP